MSDERTINPRHQVSFTYANSPERVVTIGAERVHAILTGEYDIDSKKQPITIRGPASQATYEAYCELHDLTPVKPVKARARAAAQKQTAGQDATDGWPEGVDYTVSGGWYSIEYEGETKKARGKVAAIEAAWLMVTAAE